MTDNDLLLIGELRGEVSAVKETVKNHGDKLDKVLDIVVRLEANAHTPLTCPHAATVSDLQAFKVRILAYASAAGMAAGVLWNAIKDKILGGGQ